MTSHAFSQVDVFGTRTPVRQPGRGGARRDGSRRRPDGRRSRAGPTCRRRRSCCRRRWPAPTTDCGSSPRPRSCRSRGTPRWAAPTPGCAPGESPPRRGGWSRSAGSAWSSCGSTRVPSRSGRRTSCAPARSTRRRWGVPSGRSGIEPGRFVRAQWIDNGPGWLGVQVSSAAEVLGLRPDFAAMQGLQLGVIGPAHRGGSGARRCRPRGPGVLPGALRCPRTR